MNDPWQLEWFYFADVETLITAEEGTCLNSSGVQKTYIHNELIEALMNLPPQMAKDVLLDSGAKGTYPKLMERIRDIANTDRISQEYSWDASKPWPFEKLLLRRDIPDDEIIVTPTHYILPWPFPISDSQLREDFQDHVRGIEADIPSFANDDGGYDKDNHFRLCSMMLKLDKFNAQLTSKERDELHKKEAEFRDAVHNHNPNLSLPVNAKICPDKDRNSNETYIACDQNHVMHYHIGLNLVKTPRSLRIRAMTDATALASISKEAEAMAHEPHPCGGFKECCK